MVSSKFLLFSFTIFCALIFINIILKVHISHQSKTFTVPIDERIVQPKKEKNITVLDVVQCSDKKLISSVSQKDGYVVLNNFVQAEISFKCNESITLTTPADFTFLDNLMPLARRWMGPISLALYAPGEDILITLKSIAYLRYCSIPEIRKFVTFHLILSAEHLRQYHTPVLSLYNEFYDCSEKPPYEDFNASLTYKNQNNLLYPINIARNVARENVQTHFIFPSDIELYPTPRFIKKFLNFVVKNPSYFDDDKSNVFVLPVFEVEDNQGIPGNKTLLQRMIKEERAFLFHKKVCPKCHTVIDGDKWITAPEINKEINVFSVGKRQGKYRIWEPFYICTQKEPLFDERLSWEGQGNKMTQAYSLCLLDYNFNILDNAFLTHKPGVKKAKAQMIKHLSLVKEMNTFIKTKVKQELINLYGDNPECMIKA